MGTGSNIEVYMLTVVEAQKIDGVIAPKQEVQLVCTACGYDLDESEIASDTCADCGRPLQLAQHTRIYATSVPAARGSTLA